MKATSYSKTEITLKGSEAEVDAIQKLLMGVGMISCEEDSRVIQFHDKYVKPELIPDPKIRYFFTPPEEPFINWPVPDPPPANHGDSIYVSHLCGYEYTPEYYKKVAERAEKNGFHCMRSMRGDDGRYWETWYLPGYWAAKGELKKALGDGLSHNDKNLKIVADWVWYNLKPGTMDVVRQHFAMSVD